VVVAKGKLVEGGVPAISTLRNEEATRRRLLLWIAVCLCLLIAVRWVFFDERSAHPRIVRSGSRLICKYVSRRPAGAIRVANSAVPCIPVITLGCDLEVRNTYPERFRFLQSAFGCNGLVTLISAEVVQRFPNAGSRQGDLWGEQKNEALTRLGLAQRIHPYLANNIVFVTDAPGHLCWYVVHPLPLACLLVSTPLLLVTGVLSWRLYRAQRRHMLRQERLSRSECAHCGYPRDRRVARCPECGKE